MTFTIKNGDNHGSIVFDIEFFQAKMDDDINLWHSEIRVTTVPDGLIDLVAREKERGSFNKQELKDDCKYVTGLTWWLWQQTECNQNLSTTSDKADERHYKTFLPHVKEVLKEFCDKYNLYLNED